MSSVIHQWTFVFLDGVLSTAVRRAAPPLAMASPTKNVHGKSQKPPPTQHLQCMDTRRAQVIPKLVMMEFVTIWRDWMRLLVLRTALNKVNRSFIHERFAKSLQLYI